MVAKVTSDSHKESCKYPGPSLVRVVVLEMFPLSLQLSLTGDLAWTMKNSGR